MAIRIGINGFGRIGRLVYREAVRRGDFEVVAINDLVPAHNLAYLVTYDTMHGRFDHVVRAEGDSLVCDAHSSRCLSQRDPADLGWGDLGVDIVMECTGIFTARDKAAMHLEAGAKRVLVSAPADGADKTIVYGVNHDTLTADDHVVSNASCTTNCLSPVAKVLHDAVGIEKGMMTTIHSYTGDQPTLDTMHKDLYRARAAALSMIPTSTGAAKAVGLVLPELNGKLDGVSIRVPTPNVSVVDLKFVARRATTVEEVNEAIRTAANGKLKGILGFTSDALVSTDFIGDSHTSIVDSTAGIAISDEFIKLISWYDNEWGYSTKVVDLIKHIMAVDAAASGDRSGELSAV